MANPATLDAPKKKAFSWIGDPADNFRGKGRARITSGDMKEMQAFNERLISPLDRPSDRGGEDSPIRINGAPARLAGSPARATVRPTTFQPLDATGLARIRNTQRDANGNPIGTINPALNPDRAATVTAPGNPTLYTPETEGQITPPLASLRDPTPVPNPALSPTPTPVAVQNPANEEGATGPTGGNGPGGVPVPSTAPVQRLSGQDNPGTNAEEMGGTPPSGTTNPITGAPAGLADWKAKGGSLATYHQALVQQGRRAPIDAHTGADPQGSTASAEIRASHGFGVTPQETANSAAQQMTGEFNQNNAKSQAAWNDKFKQAHAKLIDSLNNN